MNEFLTFISTGAVESFEDKFKERAYYLFKIIYYSFALIFAIGVVHEVILYFHSGNWGISIIDDSFDRKSLYMILLGILLTPIFFAYTFSFCLTAFNYSKICISLALILSFITCLIVYAYRVLPLVGGYNLPALLLFIVLAAIIYIISFNILSKNALVKAEKIWKKNTVLITYIYCILFVIFNLLFIEWHVINVIAVIIVSAFIALMLIYVRRLLGLNWSIALHYILLMPTIGFLIYLIAIN